LLALGLGPARAGNKKSPPKLDISDFASDLYVVHDGDGHYVALRTYASKAKADSSEIMFYGDGKTFYTMRTASMRRSREKIVSYRFWVPGSWRAFLTQTKGGFELKCGTRKSMYTQLSTAESAKMIGKATFRKAIFRRRPQLLARDEDLNYYYVDVFLPPRSERVPIGQKLGKDVRVWRGRKGRMKRLKLLDALSDSEGLIIETKSGRLHVVRDAEKSTLSKPVVNVEWRTKKVTKKLVKIPIGSANLKLIYTDLGVYSGKFGTPCDDV